MVETAYTVTKPIEQLETTAKIVSYIESLVDELNENFRNLEELQRTLIQTTDGANVTFNNNRLTGLAASVDPSDAVTRREILDLGLPIGHPRRAWRPSGEIIAKRAVSVPQALTRDHAVPLWQTSVVVQNVVDGRDLGMPTIRDGNLVDIEKRDGTDGTTGGVLLLALSREDELKARMLEATPKGLAIDTGQLEQLLFLILEKLEAIEQKL